MKTRPQWSRWVSAPVALFFYGLTLNEWVAVATLLYLAMQIGLLVPKYWRLMVGWWKGGKV